MKTKISIIIPIYNVENYIEKCIESIKKQTFTSYEAILINDGSTDGSLKLAEQAINADPRFRIFSKENGGLSSARNYGLKLAQGKYVAFIDSDDYIDEHFIQYLFNNIGDNDICVCNFRTIIEHNRHIGKTVKTNLIGTFNSEDILGLSIESFRIPPNAWNKLYKKTLFDEIEYPEGLLYEDLATTYKLFYKATKIVFIDDVLYNYIIRSGSIMNIVSDKNISHRTIIFNEMKKYLEDHNLYEKYQSYYQSSYLIHLIHKSLLDLVNQNKNNYKQFIQSSTVFINSSVDTKIYQMNNIFSLFKVDKLRFLSLILYKISPFAFFTLISKYKQ